MKLPRFAIENVLLHLSEHFTYLNRGEDKGVRIIEGLLYSVEGGGGGRGHNSGTSDKGHSFRERDN